MALPPGPKGQAVLGVTKEMLDDSVKPWLRFAAWSKEYNAEHLLFVPTLGTDNIIINSMQAANDLLEKRAAIYSGRPRNVFDVEIVERSMVLANIDEPDAVNRRRKLLNEDLGAQGCRSMQPVQQHEAAKFCLDILEHPLDHSGAIKRSQHSLVLRMTYAMTTSLTPTQIWTHVEWTQARPKPDMVSFLAIYPWMRHLPGWVPGCNFRAVGNDYFARDRRIWRVLLADVQSDLASGKSINSFSSRWLDNDAAGRHGLSIDDIAFAAGNLLTAGGDLPDITLRIFILAMLHHPEVLAQARSEIDGIVGRQRLPNFDDKDFLPFTRAVILEVQRWRPLTPIGVCHTNTAEDWYNGVYIPKGTRLFPSLYALSRDESVYPEPSLFKPERHLRADGSFMKRAELPTWGFGGRKCSAMHLAEGTLFINIARLIWAFEFVPPLDKDGKAILPSADYKDWVNVIPCKPAEFEITCMPRGAEVEQVLRAELESETQ